MKHARFETIKCFQIKALVLCDGNYIRGGSLKSPGREQARSVFVLNEDLWVEVMEKQVLVFSRTF